MLKRIVTIAVAAVIIGAQSSNGLRAASAFPEPAKDEVVTPAKGTETLVIAGGCFWGVEAVFERLNGVTDSVSGYAGGSKATAHYEIVSTGITGHAESVRVTY